MYAYTIQYTYIYAPKSIMYAYIHTYRHQRQLCMHIQYNIHTYMHQNQLCMHIYIHIGTKGNYVWIYNTIYIHTYRLQRQLFMHWILHTHRELYISLAQEHVTSIHTYTRTCMHTCIGTGHRNHTCVHPYTHVCSNRHTCGNFCEFRIIIARR